VTAPMAYAADGARNNAYPLKQLKGFAHVDVPAGQKVSAYVELDVNDLFFFDSTALANQVDNRTGRPTNADGTGKRVVYSGDYKIHVATSSADADIASTKILSVTGTDVAGAKPWLKNVTLRGAKVWAAPGVEMKSKLSVVMSDEVLYDTVTDSTKTAAEELGALLAKLAAAGIDCVVSYVSENENVAVVDQQGLVTAVKNGVTTITAAVTFDGVTLTASYPFAVLGKPLDVPNGMYFRYGYDAADEIRPGQTLSVFAQFDTTGDESQSMLVALYDPQGKLIKVETVLGKIEDGKIKFNADLAIPSGAPGKSSVKVFIWDAETYVPVREATSFPT